MDKKEQIFIVFLTNFIQINNLDYFWKGCHTLGNMVILKLVLNRFHHRVRIFPRSPTENIFSCAAT